jgi:hypothetical protein
MLLILKRTVRDFSRICQTFARLPAALPLSGFPPVAPVTV